MTQSQQKLFVLGDSISIQYGPYLESALAGQLAYDRKGGTGEGDASASNRNGGDSSLVLEYLNERLAEDFTCDWLLLNCGLHDIKRKPDTDALQVSIEQYQANLHTVVLGMLKEINIRPIWVSITPVDDAVHARHTQDFFRRDADVNEYNRVAAEIFTAAGVSIIDLNAFTRNIGGDLYCDHVHYHESVRKLQGEYIAAQVLSIVKQAYP